VKYFIRMLICMITISSAFAQTAQELKIAESYVVECKSVAEITQAKNMGALFIKTSGGSIFARINNEYKGPFSTLATAVKVFKQYGLQLPNTESQGSLSVPSDEFVYNPQLMIYPFTEITKDNRILFSVPDDEIVSASEVMIHPNPLQFNEVSFAPVNLFSNLKALENMNKDVPSANSLPPELKQNTYFAVTGSIASKPEVQLPKSGLTWYTGAAVVDTQGEVIWKTYGTVNAELEFKCVQEITSTQSIPQFLLLFVLGKGKMKEMLSPFPGMPKMDATPYNYHVLGSVALEMGPRWFPPLEQAAKEEYQNMLQQLEKNKPSLIPKK
jgi:hypothetical protein